MNIMNANIFNLYKSLLNNKSMKVTLKSKLTGVVMLLISTEYRQF